jgi:hypothetical protein
MIILLFLQVLATNKTENATVISFKFNKIGGMEQKDFATLLGVNCGLFITIIALALVYRMDYFHKIDQERIDK